MSAFADGIRALVEDSADCESLRAAIVDLVKQHKLRVKNFCEKVPVEELAEKLDDLERRGYAVEDPEQLGDDTTLVNYVVRARLEWCSCQDPPPGATDSKAPEEKPGKRGSRRG